MKGRHTLKRKQQKRKRRKTLRGGAKVSANNVKKEIAAVLAAQASGKGLNPTEQEVYNFLEDKAGAKDKVPPSLEFLNRTYYKDPKTLTGNSWSTELKAVLTNQTKTNQEKLTLFEQYKAELDKKVPLSKTVEFNKGKKLIAIGNRIQDLAAAAAAAGAPVTPINPDTHAGVVVKFSDGKALYTVGKDTKGKDLYGFPKGKIDFELIGGVSQKQTSNSAALRELKEETGFFVNGTQLQRATFDSAGKPTGVDPLSYTIRTITEERRTYPMGQQTVNAYYYIIEVNESSVAKGPNLSTLTENAMQENILRYEIQYQYDKNRYSPRQYNRFSKFRF